jgi:D-3-phosphoglycerate dehydrogenase
MGVELVQIDRILGESDIVSLHAAKSDKPLKLGAAEFAAMKRGSLVVNLARGNMIDEAALADALTSGHLAGAGLDVFSAEPYSGPLCDFEQVILTPHSATTPVETRAAMEKECIENALRFLRGTLESGQRVV